MDKTSKVIFALIAAALWFNAASNLLLPPAHAQRAMPSEMTMRMKSISDSPRNSCPGRRQLHQPTAMWSVRPSGKALHHPRQIRTSLASGG